MVVYMQKDEMIMGFALGRILKQEEWTDPQEIAWVDELIAEGKAILVDNWRYHDGYQCKRRIVRGVKQEH